jgi:hypothetical protein
MRLRPGRFASGVSLRFSPREFEWSNAQRRRRIDRNGSIGNSAVVALGQIDSSQATRLLSRWTALGLLQVVEGRGRKNRIYRKCGVTAKEGGLSANEVCR